MESDWGLDGVQITLQVDPDRANLSGLTNADVAHSVTAAISATQLTTLRRGDEQILVVPRLTMEPRAQLSDVQNLYVYSSQTKNKVRLDQVSSIEYEINTLRIQHFEQFRTISVQCFPAAGHLASEVYGAALPRLDELRKKLPPGYGIALSGERAKQQQGFQNLAVVMVISVCLIFLALVFQFKSAVKPFLVFAATPYGVVGAMLGLWERRSDLWHSWESQA